MPENDAQDLRWEDGVPVSTRFDDPYYSRDDGLAETRHVFHGGCGLPERWLKRTPFCIGELGFGTGLNFCATLRLWREAGHGDGCLKFVSFELYPLTALEIERALSVWPELAVESTELVEKWAAGGVMDFGSARLTLVQGDIRETLPAWQGRADAWFLDGFAPSRNPEMWEGSVLDAIGAHSNNGATLSTYSAAGHVRRGLAAAGFDVSRVKGYGRKREMITALKTP